MDSTSSADRGAGAGGWRSRARGIEGRNIHWQASSSGEHVLESIERAVGRPAVVVMSASVDGEDRARAMGADTFLAKPFTEQGLISAVDRVLSRTAIKA